MKGEGESAELVAHMLELATITPSDDATYAVGAQPVLVLWGHATEGQAVPEPPKFAVAPAVTPGRGFRPGCRPNPLSPPRRRLCLRPLRPRRPPRRHRRRIRKQSPRWARRRAVVGSPGCCRCSCCLLLALLVWRAMQPLPPIVVERPAPAPPPPADPIPAEQDREKALRAELAELTKARDERLALCKPIAPPPAPEPIAPPEPPKVTELAPPPPPPKPKPAPPKAEAKPKPQPPPTAETRRAAAGAAEGCRDGADATAVAAEIEVRVST